MAAGIGWRWRAGKSGRHLFGEQTGEVSGVHGVETILFLVVLGTVVAAFAGRLRVPAPSLLVIAGLVVALLPRFPPVHVPPEVVSLVVLPPLPYAASEELPWRDRLSLPYKAQVQAESLFEPDGLTDRQLHRDLNAAENAELARLYDNGTISQATRQQLQRGLDLEATRLSHEQH